MRANTCCVLKTKDLKEEVEVMNISPKFEMPALFISFVLNRKKIKNYTNVFWFSFIILYLIHTGQNKLNSM